MFFSQPQWGPLAAFIQTARPAVPARSFRSRRAWRRSTRRGDQVVKALESHGTRRGRPTEEAKIIDCGALGGIRDQKRAEGGVWGKVSGVLKVGGECGWWSLCGGRWGVLRLLSDDGSVVHPQSRNLKHVCRKHTLLSTS